MIDPQQSRADLTFDGVARRERLLMAVVFVVLAIGLAALVWHLAAPRLNAEEQMIVGRWYGFSGENEGEQRYAWLAEERANKTTRIMFRFYYGMESDEVVAPDSSTFLWELSDSLQVGTWSCENGRFISETHEAGLELSILTRVGWFLRDGVWPELPTYHHEYEVRKLTADEFHYDYPADSASYRAVRVTDDFVLPEKPTPLEQLRTRDRSESAVEVAP